MESGEQNKWTSFKPVNRAPLRPYDINAVLEIDGGWLFKFRHFHGASSPKTTQCITYIPDPDHSWKVEKHIIVWNKIHISTNSNFQEFTHCCEVINGKIYKNTFLSRGGFTHISIVFVSNVFNNSKEKAD